MTHAAMTRVSCLAVEPWLGGSHERFLAQWRMRSRHRVEIEGLAARQWKWRMRSAAWEIARALARRDAQPPDLLLASGFLDLPSFLGFLPPGWSARPSVLYLHENQLTYPPRPGEERAERDAHYGFTNLLSCARASAVCFNSAFHRDSFASAARELLARLPQPNPGRELERALERARVVSPGVDLDEIPLGLGAPAGSPLRVVFNHRWEHDKDPRAFLAAAAEAWRRGARLELVLLGERFEREPEGVAPLLEMLGPAIVHQGFAASRAEYARLLGTADLVVSTARHEFFGLAVCEALATGCAPLLPRRLSYPEILPEALAEEGFYADEAELAARLVRAAEDPERLRRREWRERARAAVAPFSAAETARALDHLCEELLAAESANGGV